jgi:hypothetical protein
MECFMFAVCADGVEVGPLLFAPKIQVTKEPLTFQVNSVQTLSD